MIIISVKNNIFLSIKQINYNEFDQTVLLNFLNYVQSCLVCCLVQLIRFRIHKISFFTNWQLNNPLIGSPFVHYPPHVQERAVEWLNGGRNLAQTSSTLLNPLHSPLPSLPSQFSFSQYPPPELTESGWCVGGGGEGLNRNSRRG